MRACSNQCPGSIEVVEKYNYKGYLIVNQEECSRCGSAFNLKPEGKKKFEQTVDAFINFSNQDSSMILQYGNNHHQQKLPKLEEICSQHILGKLLPKYEIIFMDTSIKNGQYDFLLKEDKNVIALEVTQAINANAMKMVDILRKNKYQFSIKSKYHWRININLYADFTHDGIKKIESALKTIENHKANINKTRIYSDEIMYDIDQLVIINELKELGVIYFHADIETGHEGLLEVRGPQEGNSLDPMSIFQIAIRECSKNDNIKKLDLSLAKEKHIFIPIDGYEWAAGFYLENIPKRSTFYKYQIKERFKGLIPNNISVIWLASLGNFHASGKRGFRLAKIVDKGDEYLIEDISNGIMPYHG